MADFRVGLNKDAVLAAILKKKQARARNLVKALAVENSCNDFFASCCNCCGTTPSPSINSPDFSFSFGSGSGSGSASGSYEGSGSGSGEGSGSGGYIPPDWPIPSPTPSAQPSDSPSPYVPPNPPDPSPTPSPDPSPAPSPSPEPSPEPSGSPPCDYDCYVCPSDEERLPCASYYSYLKIGITEAGSSYEIGMGGGGNKVYGGSWHGGSPATFYAKEYGIWYDTEIDAWHFVGIGGGSNWEFVNGSGCCPEGWTLLYYESYYGTPGTASVDYMECDYFTEAMPEDICGPVA